MGRVPLVLAGPSGVGKSTVVKELSKLRPGQFAFSVSHTTRTARPGETDGVQYHFVNREAFEALRSQDGFVETAEFSGNLYGTSYGAIDAISASGRTGVLDIDIQGVLSLKARNYRALYVMLTPPSMDELKRRLIGRGDTSPEQIESRLNIARKELEYAAKPGFFDLVMEHLDTSLVANAILEKLDAMNE